MKIGFALIVEESLLNEVIEIENKYHNSFRFRDKLGLVHNLPHTTIFQGKMKDSIAYKEIACKLVERIKDLFVDKSISFSKVVYVEQGWYFWECKYEQAFYDLAQYALSLLKNDIVLEEDRMQRDFAFLSKKEQTAIEKYGYRYADDAYYPHITIGRSNGYDKNIVETLNDEFLKVDSCAKIDRVTVYRMGANGTHSETLFEIRL